MKTSESFFPTRTHLKSRGLHQQHTFQVVKLRETPPLPTSAKVPTEPVNIFRDCSNPPRKEEATRQYFRPVGGPQLFRKMEQGSRDRYNDNRKLSKRSNRDNTQRNITSNSGPRFKRERLEPEDGEGSPLKAINENKEPLKTTNNFVAEECLKSHASYEPTSSASKFPTGLSRFGSSAGKFRNSASLPKGGQSENAARPMTAKGERHEVWAAEQRREYQDKAALLNEINYNKPLVEVYGERYFQYLLRNRFEEDFKPPPYVYLLSSNKFTDSRAIAKIKRYRPDIKQKEMLLLRGRGLRPDGDEM